MTDRAVYVVRHGRTALNASGVIRGRTDVPLDGTGIREARALGELFTGVAIARVITSPLGRAVRTAEAIGSGTGAPLIEDPRLLDRDYGPWEGRPEQEVLALLLEAGSLAGIEPEVEVGRRARRALEDRFEHEEQGGIVLVAHLAVNRSLLVDLVPSLGDPGALPQPTGCWSLVQRSEQGWTAPVIGAVPGDGRLP